MPSENDIGAARIKLFQLFNWTKVATIHQNTPRFILVRICTHDEHTTSPGVRSDQWNKNVENVEMIFNIPFFPEPLHIFTNIFQDTWLTQGPRCSIPLNSSIPSGMDPNSIKSFILPRHPRITGKNDSLQIKYSPITRFIVICYRLRVALSQSIGELFSHLFSLLIRLQRCYWHPTIIPQKMTKYSKL